MVVLYSSPDFRICAKRLQNMNDVWGWADCEIGFVCRCWLAILTVKLGIAIEAGRSDSNSL